MAREEGKGGRKPDLVFLESQSEQLELSMKATTAAEPVITPWLQALFLYWGGNALFVFWTSPINLFSLVLS